MEEPLRQFGVQYLAQGHKDQRISDKWSTCSNSRTKITKIFIIFKKKISYDGELAFNLKLIFKELEDKAAWMKDKR